MSESSYPVIVDPSDHWDDDPGVFDTGPRADQEMLLVHGPVHPPLGDDETLALVTLANSHEFAAARWCKTAKDIDREATGHIYIELATPETL